MTAYIHGSASLLCVPVPKTSENWKKARRTNWFLIMRLLACPIFGNQHRPWGWKT